MKIKEKIKRWIFVKQLNNRIKGMGKAAFINDDVLQITEGNDFVQIRYSLYAPLERKVFLDYLFNEVKKKWKDQKSAL